MTPSWNSWRTTCPVPIHLHQARLHQPIDARVEAAQPGRQLLREHVQRALREVHRRAALVRLGVERAALARRSATRRRCARRARSARSRSRSIEIASSKSRACSPSIVTMSRPRKSVRPAQVLLAGVHGAAPPRPPAAAAPRRPPSSPCASGRPYLRMMIVVSTPGSSMSPEHLDHAADRPARRRRPPRDLDGHHRRRAARRASRPAGPRRRVRRRRSNGTTKPRPAVVHVEPADDASRCARSRILTMRPSGRSPSRKRSTRTTTRSPCIASFRCGAATKTSGSRRSRGALGRPRTPKPSGLRLQPADDEVHLVGQAVALAAHLDEQARRRRAP